MVTLTWGGGGLCGETPGHWNEAAVCYLQTPTIAWWPAVSNCPQVPTIQSPRPPGIGLCSVWTPILPAHLLAVSTHSFHPQPLLAAFLSLHTPFASGPVPSPRLLPASLPASFSARLQLGDNLPHLASRLLPRLIAQLVPGARPSFFPTPTPSSAPKLPQPFPVSLTHSLGTSCPLGGWDGGSRAEGSWLGPELAVS